MSMKISLKKNVSLSALSPQMSLAITAASFLAEEYGWPFFVITSANDSKHSETSLHYSGNAVDIRVRDPKTGTPVPAPDTFAFLLSNDLGADFDVIFEQDHIHIEYQPKRR